MKKVIISTVIMLFLMITSLFGQYFDQPSYISVTGDANLEVVPDEVIITLGVETSDLQMNTAKDQNDEIVSKAIEIAKSYGIDENDIQTNYMNIEPRYEDYYEYKEFLGYFVQKTIVITIKDLSDFEQFVSDILDQGVNYVHGIQFQTSEIEKYKEQARLEAIRNAKEKAQMLAQALDMEIGAPISVCENQTSWWSWNNNYWGYSWSEMSCAGGYCYDAFGQTESPMAPGQITISASITVSFELE